MAENPIVKEAVETALEIVQEYCPPEEFDTEQKRKELQEAAEAVAKEELDKKSAFEFVHTSQTNDNLHKLVSQTLAQHASSEQLRMIKTGLQIPSYRINFRFEKGKYHADITKSAAKYMDSVKLDTAENFATISGLQIASIVVEAIGLVLSIIGISVPEGKMAEVAAKMAKQLYQSPTVLKAIEVLKRVFSSAGSSSTSKATAVWELLKAVWEDKQHGNIFTQIVKLLLSDWSAWDIAKAVVKITALIVAAVASGGTALIAKIVLALMSAYEFTKKVTNLKELDEIRAAAEV